MIPTLIIRKFIRTETESDWLLHLHWVQQMLPYFFATGHSNCAPYETLYLLEMQGALSAAVHQMFMNGITYRHRSGIWNPLFSDKFWRSNVYSVRQSQMWVCWNHTESRSSGRVGAFILHLQHGFPGDGRHIRQRGRLN